MEKDYEKFTKSYRRFMNVILLFLILVHWLTIMWSKGIEFPIDQVVKIGLSLLILVIGNDLGQIRQSYTFGIKTLWTLASESVWIKTHRLCSYVFVLCGLVMLGFVLIPGIVETIVFLIALTVLVIFSVLVSYLFYIKGQS